MSSDSMQPSGFKRNQTLLIWRICRRLYREFYTLGFRVVRKIVYLSRRVVRKIIYLYQRVIRKIVYLYQKLVAKIACIYRAVQYRINYHAAQVGEQLSKPYLRMKQYIRLQYLEEDVIFTYHSNAVNKILKQGDARAAVRYLKRHYFFYKPPIINFLLMLYQFIVNMEQEYIQLWPAESGKEKVIISFCSWGDSYAQKVVKHLLPSLLAQDNMPNLSARCDVVLLIHCDAKTKALIESCEEYSLLKAYVNIVFCLFPQELIDYYQLKSQTVSCVYPQIRYLMLGACQTHAFKVALRDRCYLSYLMPDVVLSETFYKNAFSRIEDRKLVLTTTYRSNYGQVYPRLNELYQSDKALLSISENKLLQLQIDHIHPYELKRIVSTRTMNFSSSARLIFKNANGFIMRCFHYHPILINCARITKPVRLDYMPIDNTALNDVFDSSEPYADQAYVCTAPSEMSIMELSDENPELEVILNKTTLSYDQLVGQVKHLLQRCADTFDTPLNRYLASFRHEFIVPGHENKLMHDDEVIDDVQFFQDLTDSRRDATAPGV